MKKIFIVFIVTLLSFLLIIIALLLGFVFGKSDFILKDIEVIPLSLTLDHLCVGGKSWDETEAIYFQFKYDRKYNNLFCLGFDQIRLDSIKTIKVLATDIMNNTFDISSFLKNDIYCEGLGVLRKQYETTGADSHLKGSTNVELLNILDDLQGYSIIPYGENLNAFCKEYKSPWIYAGNLRTFIKLYNNFDDYFYLDGAYCPGVLMKIEKNNLKDIKQINIEISFEGTNKKIICDIDFPF
jgi:hypothetical protein